MFLKKFIRFPLAEKEKIQPLVDFINSKCINFFELDKYILVHSWIPLDYDNEIESVLGFKKGQLLVSFYYNTPNNTLSSFWRPSKVSQPLFIRNKYIRPSTSEIRKNKERIKKQSIHT